jgi:hypothetical protein
MTFVLEVMVAAYLSTPHSFSLQQGGEQLKFRVFWDVVSLEWTDISDVCTASIIRVIHTCCHENLKSHTVNSCLSP